MKIQAKKGIAFQKKLRNWYKIHHRKLPWRETRSAYKIWISEIMLQQTTVQAVIPYFYRWMKLFPDVDALSKASLQKVLKAWEGLGYYQRAKNLHTASKAMVEKYKSQIPQDYETLKNLPGFGPYTTAAVLSFAFDKHFLVLDANVIRVVMRLMRLRREVNPKNDEILRQFLSPFFPQTNPGSFNQAMMELGALVCRPKNPACNVCPLIEFCLACIAGEQEIIPRPKKRSYQKIDAVIGIIKKHGKYLIQKRPPIGLLADLWEFPGGKRKRGETLEEALHREIREELHTEIKEIKFLTKVQHSYTQFQVTLYAYDCFLRNEPHTAKGIHRWTTLKGLSRYPFPSGSAKIIKFLEDKDTTQKGDITYSKTKRLSQE